VQRFKEVVTPGRALALVLTFIGIYYGWGFVFVPGGTGSNVVLGMLLALAALYLVTVNLGAWLDDLFFLPGTRELTEGRRFAEQLAADVKKAMDKADRAGRTEAQAEARERLAKALEKLEALLEEPVPEPGEDAQKRTEAALKALKAAVEKVEDLAEKAIGPGARPSFFQQVRSLGIAFAVALALRAFVVEPFQIPSGSMIPTLLIGDHLFVARFWYGLSVPMVKEPSYFVRWSVPEPGDVVVFVAPPWVGPNSGEDWIKRVIAGPGQTVKMREGVLHVDDKPYELLGEEEPARFKDYDESMHRWSVRRARHRREMVGEEREHSIYLGHPTRLDWPISVPGTTPRFEGLECTENECRVKDGFIFVMGDNRDNSSDGRVWGAVPIDNVKGRALFIWMSVDGSQRSVELGRFTLPGFNWDRVFDAIE
jgi:signal peptidase I